MNDLLDNVYLPDLKKRSIRESDAYKLLKDNNKDTSVLEGYDNTENIEPIEFPVFNTQGDKDKFIEENATSTASTAKDYLETFGNFLTDETEDLVTSLQLAAVNGADVAVNLMPLAYKMFETAPIAMAMPKEFFNTETEEDVMRVAKHYSDNLGEYRKHLFEKQKDNGWVKDILSLVVQDSAYSIPAFNMMRKAGVPKYPAFFLSAAFGAIGVENVDRDGDKTYFAPFQKDVQELKKLLNILPDTPADKIADEVHQALEYGSFGTAIPGIIDAFVFMKKYLPKFSTVTGSTAAVVGMTADNEAEGSPFKAIVNAVTKAPVFKSSVIDTVEKKITKGPGQQVFNTIKNTPGVKESELKWMGLENFLKDKKNVTQEEVLEFINANKLDVNERRFGAADMQQGQAKPLKDFSKDEFRKLEDQIYEDIENGSVRDEYRYVADHINYLKAANFQRLDNFPIKKTENFDELPTEVTDQNYNMGSYMNDNNLYTAVEGLDDYSGGEIGFDYWENTFAEFYEVFAIKSKGTKTLVDDALERELYKKFAEDQMTLPDEMIRNADVNNGFHIQADAFEDFKKYLDDAGAYIARYNKMEIPKDQRRAVYNETMIRSNEEMYYQNSGDMDSISQAMEEYVGAGLNRGKYEQYTAPGGEAYSEIVFTLSKGGENLGNTIPIETPVTKRETAFSLGLRSSPHFDVSGEIAHVRFKTRDQGNMRILSVEEMQSDLVQAVKQSNEREIDQMRTNYLSRRSMEQQQANVFENISEDEVQAYLKNNEPKDIIKDFPFKNNWYELVLKRLIRYAADNGYDAISIPKAKIIQDRYNLTRRINKLNITAYFPERQEIGIMGRDQDGITEFDDLYTFEKLKKEFGEDVQKKIIDLASKSELDDALTRAETDYKAIVDGDDEYPSLILDKAIEIGGQGKARLYNKTIPSFLKKYGKKWNAKVFDDEIKTSDGIISGKAEDRFMPVTIIEITPEMKQSVQTTSQPLFELFGGVSIGSLISESVSDNMKNNIISQNTN